MSIKWRHRYESDGISGLYDKTRSGRNIVYGEDARNRVLKKLDETPPDGLARWDGSILARELTMPKHAIWRILKREEIQLARRRSWYVSTDPEFTQRTIDIVGLYLNPPENALVLRTDEGPGTALTRTVGSIQCRDKAMVRAYQNAYGPGGAVNLCAALDVARGHVYGTETQKGKRVDFFAFLEELLRELPGKEETVYQVMVDTCGIHKRCALWLKEHKNVVFHYAPTSENWLHMMELWFGIINREISRGAPIESKEDLTEHVKKFIEACNKNELHPFLWRKRAVGEGQMKEALSNLCS